MYYLVTTIYNMAGSSLPDGCGQDIVLVLQGFGFSIGCGWILKLCFFESAV